MPRNVIVRILPRIDHVAEARMTAAMRKAVSGGMAAGGKEGQAAFAGVSKGMGAMLAAAIGAALMSAVDSFERRVTEVLEKVASIEIQARHERLQSLTEEQKEIYGSILASGISEKAAAEGFGATRAFTALDEDGIRRAGEAFARLEEIGGSSEAMSAIIRRWQGRDAPIETIEGLTNIFAALSAEQGRPVSETIGAVETHGTSFGVMGLTPIHAAATSTSLSGQGYSPAQIMGLIARTPKHADKVGASPLAFLAAMQRDVMNAKSDAEAAAIISKYLPGGLSETPRVQLAQYIRRGNDIVSGVDLRLLEDPGLSVVSGSPMAQLDAATMAAVMSGDPSAVPGGSAGTAAAAAIDSISGRGYVKGTDPVAAMIMNVGLSLVDRWFGSGQASAERVAAGQQMLRDNMFLGGQFERSLLNDHTLPDGTPLWGDEGTRNLVLQNYMSNPMFQRSAEFANVAGATGYGLKTSVNLDFISDAVLRGKIPDPTLRHRQIARFDEMVDDSGLLDTTMLEEVEKGEELELVLRNLKKERIHLGSVTEVERENTIKLIETMVDNNRTYEEAQEAVRLLGFEFAQLQGLSPEDQLREINAMFQALEVPTTEEVGAFLNLLSDFASQGQFSAKYTQAVADSLVSLGSAIPDQTMVDRLNALVGGLNEYGAWVDGLQSDSEFPEEHKVLVNRIFEVVEWLKENPGATAAGNLPTQGGGTEEATEESRGVWQRTLEMAEAWKDIIARARELGATTLPETTLPSVEKLEKLIKDSKDNVGYALADVGSLGATSEEQMEGVNELVGQIQAGADAAGKIRDYILGLDGRTVTVTIKTVLQGVDPSEWDPGLLGGGGGSERAGGGIQTHNDERKDSAATEDSTKSREPDYFSGNFGL